MRAKTINFKLQKVSSGLTILRRFCGCWAPFKARSTASSVTRPRRPGAAARALACPHPWLCAVHQITLSSHPL